MKYRINAMGLGYKELNLKIKKKIQQKSGRPVMIELSGVCGQRYIGDGIKGDAGICIKGVPGNDLGAFMDGPHIEVYGNGQDGIGNTMNSGKIIIHGSAGDIVGYSMRGGEIYIKGNAGWRSGIHMKSYKSKIPVLVIGGKTGDFLGEYMAGGIIIILNLFKEERADKNSFFETKRGITGNYTGTGMHGGVIYLRGQIADHSIGKEVKKMKLDKEDKEVVAKYIEDFAMHFGFEKELDLDKFTKLSPFTHRPYGKLYAY